MRAVNSGGFISHAGSPLKKETCSHQGITDVIRHIKSQGHQEKQKVLQSASNIAWFSVPVAASVGGMSTQDAKTRRAEVKVAVSLVEHNVQLAVEEHLGPLFKKCFTDSQIVPA